MSLWANLFAARYTSHKPHQVRALSNMPLSRTPDNTYLLYNEATGGAGGAHEAHRVCGVGAH